jgi:hypothetical protein
VYPPKNKYKCSPIPAETWPPIPPEYLLHHFLRPSCINEQETWILNQLPKRTRGSLHGKADKPAKGWGIYYKEGLDTSKILLMVFLFMILISILVGVLWSVYKMDVQGAFGVSAWVTSVGGIGLTLLIWWLDQA